MSEKNKAKGKQVTQADLNYITNKSHDKVIAEMESIKRFDFSVEVVRLDEDKALFQMTYTRDKHITAEVVGRLQSWAGDMTHVSGYRRFFRKKSDYIATVFRLMFAALFISPFIIWLLSLVTTGRVHDFISSLMSWSFAVSFLLALNYLNVMFTLKKQPNNLDSESYTPSNLGKVRYDLYLRNLMTISKQSDDLNSVATRPHQDHERLTKYLAEIIRDEHFDPDQSSLENQDINPLTNEELAVLQQHEKVKRA